MMAMESERVLNAEYAPPSCVKHPLHAPAVGAASNFTTSGLLV